MDTSKVEALRAAVAAAEADPCVLLREDLSFFRDYLQRLGANVPVCGKPAQAATQDGTKQADETIADADNDGVVEPDNDPPQPDREAAAMAKAAGSEAMAAGDPKRAVEHFTEAVERNPSSAMLHANRALAYAALKKPNAAMRDAEAALNLNPDSAKAYRARGEARALLGQWEDAAKDLAEACRIDYDPESDAKLRQVQPKAQQIAKARHDTERQQREARERAEQARKRDQQQQQQQASSASSQAPALADLMNDPELMAAMSDPDMQPVMLDMLSSDPATAAAKHAGNPKVAALMARLMAKLGKTAPGGTTSPPPQQQTSAAPRGVRELHSRNEWEQLLQSTAQENKLLVVDFYATWCGPCKVISPRFADLAKNPTYADKVVFAKVDVDQVRDVAAKEGISAMPTFKYYKNGRAVDTLQGADLHGLMMLLDKHK
eukprot:jgi/Chlat1/3328/Chrsp22S03470